MNLQDNEALRNKLLQIYAYQMMFQNFQNNNVINQKSEPLYNYNNFFPQNLRNVNNFPINFDNLSMLLPKDMLISMLQSQNDQSNKRDLQETDNNSTSFKKNSQRINKVRTESLDEGKRGNLNGKKKVEKRSDSDCFSNKEGKNCNNKPPYKNIEKKLKKESKKIRREKSFNCSFRKCRKRFFTEYKLKVHRRVHKGIRPFRCDIPYCCQTFFNRESFLNHKKNGHVEENKNLKFSCEHQGCTLRFKTKKQKLSHHNKLELECKEEKNILIKLVSKFNKALFSLAKTSKLDLNEVEKLEEIEDLKQTYEKTTLKLQDPDFFFFCVGDKLQFPSMINN
jgi:hypothetical protein